jgi:hypothetical protein
MLFEDALEHYIREKAWWIYKILGFPKSICKAMCGKGYYDSTTVHAARIVARAAPLQQRGTATNRPWR